MIDGLWTGLVKGDHMPNGGYSAQLTKLKKKPLIMCGQNPWVYYDKMAPDPYDNSKLIHEVFPRVGSELGLGWPGAYIHKHRYEPAESNLGASICAPGIYGVTQQKHDMITFCDPVFALKPEKSAVRNADEVKEGVNIDDAGIATTSIARVMIHEFAHYYGSRVPEKWDGNPQSADLREFEAFMYLSGIC